MRLINISSQQLFFTNIPSFFFSISTERHRAEVRRVVNDDRLNDVAEWYVIAYIV